MPPTSDGQGMRFPLAFAIPLLLLGGCVPEIAVKPDFATSALQPTGDIPPEFAAFNNYQSGVNPLLAKQICATPYIPQVVQTAAAVPGTLVAATGRCQNYAPFVYDPNSPPNR
jgi:hypothetical protein